ncbi:hypothetical protein B0J14DRAFT_572698 [Halenospora varia]|nr:hypothetical protein B0J14DRAFT_572698 [Halenospora varia]
MQISCEGKDDSSLTLRGGFTVPEKGFHGTDISSAFSHPRRHSSYDIEFEHIEYLLSDAEIESQVGVEAHEETPSTISELSLGLGTEMVQATTGARRPTSSVSYTSYIEAEFAAASLYQRPLGISTEKTGTFHQSSTANHNPKMPSTEVDTSDRYLHTKGGLDARIISIGSFASGFRFTDYATELPESKMDDETIICVKDIEGDVMGDEEDVQVVHETMNFKQEVDEEVSVAPEYVPIFGDIEPADLVRESNNSPQAITTEDLNIRMIGKAARKSLRMKRETGKIGGLIDIFQARGLMPQNLKSPIHRPQGPLTQHESSPSRSTTMGTTPFGLPPFPYRNSKDFPFQLESTQRKPRCAILLSRSYSGASDADTEISSVSGYSLERSEKRQENEKKRRDDRDSDMYG